MNFSLEELAEKIRTEFKATSTLNDQLQGYMKEIVENVHSSNVEKFTDVIFPVFIEILNGQPSFFENAENHARALILDLLSKIALTTTNFPQYEKVFQILLDIMQRDNENNGITAARLLSDILKATTQHQFSFETVLKPLFGYLSTRAQLFFNRVDEIIRNPAQKNLYQISQPQPQGQTKLIKSSESIKLIMEIPNLFVYACHFVEPNNEFVKNSLNGAIVYFINTLHKMPYQELAKNAPKPYFTEMINTVIKLFHFITLILKQQITNEKIREYLHSQTETIKSRADDMADCIMLFFRNVHDDFTASRIELINYLRFHVKALGPDKFKNYINLLLEDDVVFGRQRFKSIYGKNLIYQHWLETMQHLVPEMTLPQISKTFDIVAKNLYDNNLYNNIQYHSLILHQKVMDVHFLNRRNAESQENTQKLVATKILEKLILKFKQIKEKIVEINDYLGTKYPDHENTEKNPILLSNLPSKVNNFSEEDEIVWNQKKLKFIEEYDSNTDAYLFSQSWIHYKTLNIYEDEDELVINCWTINPSTVNEYLKEIKDKIVPALFDSIRSVIDFISNNSTYAFNAPPSNGQPRPQVAKLTEEECYLLGKLLKYGLECMDLLHNYKNPMEDREKMLNFFIIFVGLQETKNIKDIFETNFKSLFDITLKYTKYGTEESLQNLLSPLIDGPKVYEKSNHLKQYVQQINNNWRVFAEILIRQLFIKLENSPDELSPFHPYYEYQNEYHPIIYKLIKMCFRCLNKHQQDQFIEGIFKQIIMVLFKKTHSSKYSIEYILLLRNLFKNILNQKSDNLFVKFQQLCESGPSKIDIIKNFVALYETGLPELNDVLSELILILPLRTKYLLFNSKMLIGPIISALNLTDNDFLKRGLKTIDVILNNYQNYQNEDIENLLVDVKQKLIGKLYFFMWNATDSDILYATSKLLGKLGHYPRTHKLQQKFLPMNASDAKVDLTLIEREDGQVEVNMSLVEAIRLSIDLIDQFFENKSLVQIKISCLESSWTFLQSIVHKLIEKKINPDDLRAAVLNNNSLHFPQYGNKETLDIISEIFKVLLAVASHAKRKELEEMFQNIANVFVVSYLMNPDKEDPGNLFFLYAIIDNIKYRIIYIRGSHNDSYYNNSYSIIKTIIDKIQSICINSAEVDHRIYHLILMRLVRVCHTKELINCHGAISCLAGLTEIVPSRYFIIHYFDILESVFNVIQKIPEVIQLPVFDKCLELLKILAGYYPSLSDKGVGLHHICDSLVNQLLSANENQHEAAKFFLRQISKATGLKFPLVFFESDRGNATRYGIQRTDTDVQIQISKTDLIKENLPISKILVMQDKVFSELNTKKTPKEQTRYLHLLRSSIETLNLLVSERVLPYRFVDERECTLTEDFKKIINLFETIIAKNDEIYKPFVYIIMEEEKKTEGTHSQPPASAQNYTINKNILYDDDEFNVNIEDVDLAIKVWSKLISSVLVLMQNLMTHRTVNLTIKSRISRRDRWDRNSDEINETRNKVIFKFFNMMLRIERNIRKTASRGLKTLIRLENQPKDLLTEENLKVILRPILICLQQQHQIFNIPFLNVLRKLVKYLNQCFNRTLSDKLAEHLTKFMEVLCSGNRRYPGPEPVVDERKIASGIFYLFEYLPHASQYVDLIIKLNNKIDNTIVQLSGMYCMNYLMRKPLLRIVNCYASGSVELFLTNLKDYSKIFLYVLKADCSHAIRERLMRETQNFLERTFNNQSVFDLTSEAIRIIRIISKRNPSWLLKNRIIPSLLQYWNSKDLKQQPADDEFAKDRNRDEISQILRIFVQYCKNNKKEIKIIFDILPIFNLRHSTDFSFLHKFYRYYIPENYSSEEKRDIFLHFLEYIKNPAFPIETKANASYILIYPMMLKCFKSGKARDMFSSRVIDEVCNLVTELVRKKPVEYGRLEIEILQICGLIITYLKDEYMSINQPGVSGDDRKIDLLRLGWNLMKNEDRVYANVAKLFICKFISKYGLLYDQTMQLYISLLKGQEYINSHDNDIKLLSRKALDILIPYLPNVRHQNENPNAPPKWITWTCRIFNEENWINSQGYSFARFWQVFIRMHKIFAKYRSSFSTQMINSMQYLVLPHHQSSMYKKIAIDLALLYMEWHYQDLKEKLEREMDSDKKMTIISQPFNEQTKDIREIFINFFIKLAINSCQDKEEKENITRKALFLLKKWLIISPGTLIKYQFIEKTLTSAQNSTQYYSRDGPEKKKSCFTVLMIISTLLSFDRVENIQTNMDLIFKILTHPFSNCFTCDNPYIIQLISNLTRKLLNLNSVSFQNRIIDLIESGVNAYIQAYQSRSSNQSQYAKNAITIYTTIRISKVLLEYRPEELDKFFEAFLQISRIFIELFDNRKFYNAPTGRKSGDDDEDLLANIDNHYTEEGFENHKFSFSNLREFLIILLRILSQKLTKFSSPESKEKIHMIELLESIMEKLPDIDLTIEVLSILNSLLLSDYYTNITSHISLVKGCFTTKEKILYFLEYKKVQYIMEKHSANRHPDSERVVRKYSKLIIDLLRAIPLKEIEIERLRKLIVILNKYVPTDMSDLLFEIVKNHFGDSFKKKIMFFFYEFSDENHVEDHSEGDEDLLSTVVNYLIYMIPQYYKIEGPNKVFPLLDSFKNTSTIMNIESDTETLGQCLKQLGEFMESLQKYPATDMLMKFRKLLTVEYIPKKEILRVYFSFLFTLTWNKLPRSDQQVIVQALENYLTTRNCLVSANVILYTAERLYPAIKFKPEIIQYLAKTNYTWHTSLYILEKYAEAEQDEEFENSVLSLIELYTRLDEKDYAYGLKRLLCDDETLKKALSLSQYRLWVKAGKTFSSYIETSNYDPSSISDVLNKRLAEEGWINVHKQLNDWSNVQNVIKGIENVDLHIELAWQTKDKRTLEKFIQSTETFNADSLMIQSILRLSQFAETVRTDDNVGFKKVDESISGSFYCSLLEWNALPKYYTNSHKNILVRLQSLIEIDEATSIISKIKEKDYVDGIKEHFAHQLIAHMDIWKSRMPSSVEDLTIWKTILDQRNYLYHLIKKRLELLLAATAAASNANPPIASSGTNSNNNTVPSTPSRDTNITDVEKKLGYFSDIIWNNLKYASVERRFGFFGQMKGPNRSIWNDSPQTPGEVYLSMKEQIMWRLNAHFDYDNALKIANNAINNELLSIEHKSEMHRLKVLLNMQLGKLEDANNECIEALKICDTNWKCWHTWAIYCFKSFCQLKNLKWAEQTIVCFVNGIKYKPHKTRLLIADILWMLTHDDRNKIVLKAFEKAIEELPVWIWIIWIPQFLAAINKPRPETKASVDVLKKIARDYPQALYYYLKRFKHQPNQPGHTGFEGPLNPLGEIHDEMKKSEPILYECLDLFSEFIPSLNINQEEKMINEINSLVISLYLLDSLAQLDRFRLKIFLMLRSFESHIQRIPFTEVIRMQSANLSEILGILKSFINNMKENHRPHVKPFDKIDAVSLMKLEALIHDLLEVPGQYNVNHEPFPDNHVKIVEVASEVECIERSRAMLRIIAFRGNNGKTYQYIIKNRPPVANTQQEAPMMFLNSQLKQIMNIRFNSHRETSIRNLKLKNLNEYFINWEISLIEHKPKLKSMSDILDEFFVSKNIDPDIALELYLRENTFENTIAKQDIFKKLDKMVANDLIRKFALKSVKNLDEYFLFRNNFICTYGMENFFSYVISNELHVEQMYIDSAKGDFYYMDMKPTFTEQGQIVRESHFNSIRVSKNIENFITNMGLEGLFSSCFIAGSMAFVQHDTDLSTLLFIYLRDSMVKTDQTETTKKELMDSADELKQRIVSFSFEGSSSEEVSDKIYRAIIDLTSPQSRLNIPKKYKYWF